MKQVLKIVMFVSVLAAGAQAATYYWDGSANVTLGSSDNTNTSAQNWLSDGLWDSGTTSASLASWTAGDSAIFGGSAASQTITAGAFTIGNLTFGQGATGSGTSGTAYTITGGTLTLSTTTITANTATTISSVLAGTSSLTKAGSGILTLTNVNTYTGTTGTTTVNGGTLSITGGAKIYGGTGGNIAVTINSGGTLEVDNFGWAGNLGNLWTNAGNFILNGGTLRVLQDNAATRPVRLDAASTYEVAAGKTVTQDFAIAGTGGLTKSGNGTLAITAVPTYSGATTVNNGTLKLNFGYNAAFATPSITISSGATVDLAQGDVLYWTAGKGALTINSGGTVTQSGTNYRQTIANTLNMTGGTLTSSGVGDANGNYSFLNGVGITATSDAAGNAALVSANKISIQGGTTTLPITVTRGAMSPASDLIISSIIANFSGNTGALTKSGTGILTLSGANTYTGNTTLNAGTLDLANVNALQNSSLMTGTTGTRAVTFSVAGTNTYNLGGLAGSLNLDIGANSLAIGNNDPGAYTGTISGTGGVTLKGGVLRMGGTQSYSGTTTIQGGYLEVSQSALSLANSLFNVTSTAGNAVDIWAGKLTVRGLTGTGIIVANGASGNAFSGTALDIATPGGESYTFNGTLKNATWSSGVMAIEKSGEGKQTLTGTNIYTGATTISAGTLEIGGSATLGTGTYAGAISNTGTLAYNSSASQTLSGKISGTGALKVSSGTLTLSNAANDYTGATTVNGGTLNVTGAIAAGSAVSVASGATLKGTGTVGGTVTAASGGIITGGDGSSGKLTIGNLTFSGNGIVNVGNINNYSSSAALDVTTTLTLAGGGNLITVNLGSATPTSGTIFHLISNGAFTTSSDISGFQLGTTPTLSDRQSGGALVANTGYLDFEITGVYPYWTGARSSEWSTATLAEPKNWETAVGVTTDYLEGDVVLFDDRAVGTAVIISDANVSPTSVAFNSSKDYTLSGAFGITGATGLTKSGTGMLTMSNVNSFDGAATINGGMLKMGSDSALGSTTGATTVASGATLDLNGHTVGAEAVTISGTGVSAGGVLVNSGGTAASLSGNLTLGAASSVGGSGDMTLSGAVGGGFALTKVGTGTLALSGNNTYTGGTTVNGGMLAVNGPSSGATGAITINSGGTLIVDSNWNNAGNVDINSGGTLTLSSGGLYRNAGGGDIYQTAYAITVKTGGVFNLKGWGYNLDGGFGGASDYSGQRVIDGGTVNITGNSNTGPYSALFRVTANGGSFNMLTAGQTTTISSNGNDSIRVGGTLTFGGAGDITVNDQIVNNTSAGSVIYAGSGTLTLGGANTFSGSLSADSGTVVVTGTLLSVSGVTANSGSIMKLNATNMFVAGHGVAVSDTMVLTANGGALVMDTGMESRIGSVTLTNGGTWTSDRGLGSYDILLANTTAGAATVTVSGAGAATMNGTGGIHLQGVQNFDVADVTGNSDADLTVSMTLAGPGSSGGAAGGLYKTGAGTMVLSGANTYTGDTTVNGGTLSVTGSLQSAAMTVNDGGTLRVNGTTTGTMTVNAGGTLRVDGTASGTGAVRTGGILMGTGTVGGLNIEGTVAPGASIGSLKVTDYAVFNTSALYEFEFTGRPANPDPQVINGDLVAITGGLTIVDGATLKLMEVGSGTWVEGDKLTLISYTGGWDFTRFKMDGGDYIDNDSPFMIGSNQWKFKYDDLDKGSNYTTDASTGTQFVTMTIVAIPEPGTLGVLGLCLAVSFLRARPPRRS